MLKDREEAWGTIEKLARQNPHLEKLSNDVLSTNNDMVTTEPEPCVEHVTDLSKVSE